MFFAVRGFTTEYAASQRETFTSRHKYRLDSCPFFKDKHSTYANHVFIPHNQGNSTGLNRRSYPFKHSHDPSVPATRNREIRQLHHPCKQHDWVDRRQRLHIHRKHILYGVTGRLPLALSSNSPPRPGLKLSPEKTEVVSLLKSEEGLSHITWRVRR